MVNAGTVYLVTTENSRINVAMFNGLGASPIVATIYSSLGNAIETMVGQSMILTSTYSDFYIGGSILGNPLLMKVSTSTGTISYKS